MEKIELKIPNLGDAQSTQIIEVNIKPGDEVSLNDPLIVLESEKAAMEVPSDFNGKIKQVFVKQDDEVMEGVIYASIEIEEETVDAPELQKPNKQVDEEYQENKSTQRKNENHSFKGINAGPAVRKYARELEINLNLINGTGNSGRITKDDLKRFIHSNKESDIDSSLPTAEDFSNFGEIEVQKMSKIQKYALTNLTNAWNSIPHVTHFDEADITNINIARKEIGISPLAYIIESVCKNLKKFPKFNSSLLKK
jgi:pyruvate dehydrogenase E2 component (dihydrolipoamide acetyltransferase)